MPPLIAAGPASGVDLFADPVLEDPYPVYEALRTTGRVVWLDQHQAWFAGRHEEVSAVLTRPKTFSCEHGVALTSAGSRQPPESTVPPRGGQRHLSMRSPLSRHLNSGAVKALTAETRSQAELMAHQYTAREEFDAVEFVTRFVAGRVVRLMDLPETAGPELVASALAVVDMSAPDHTRYHSETLATAMTAVLSRVVSRKTARRGSWLDRLYKAADTGYLSECDVVPLMAAYVTSGVDTTICGITAALHHLARSPMYFRRVRAERLDPAAVFHEAIRLDAPVQVLERRVTRDALIGDTRLRAGQRVWASPGSSGRDPRRWGSHAAVFRPERADGTQHLAFGLGPHSCAGRQLAQMYAVSLLQALARFGTRLEIAGDPVRTRSSAFRGWKALPLRITPDRRRFRARASTV